jgi:hypothetical protein
MVFTYTGPPPSRLLPSGKLSVLPRQSLQKIYASDQQLHKRSTHQYLSTIRVLLQSPLGL